MLLALNQGSSIKLSATREEWERVAAFPMDYMIRDQITRKLRRTSKRVTGLIAIQFDTRYANQRSIPFIMDEIKFKIKVSVENNAGERVVFRQTRYEPTPPTRL